MELETLVIDRARRDPILFLLSQVGRAARIAPARVRGGISRWLTID